MLGNFVSKLKVRSKLVLLVAVPTVATILAAQVDLRNALEKRAGATETVSLAEVSIAGGNLVLATYTTGTTSFTAIEASLASATTVGVY